MPGASFGWTVGAARTGEASDSSARAQASLEVGFIDVDYFEVMGISLLAGRPLSVDFASDNVTGLSAQAIQTRGANAVIDLEAARALGFARAQDAVGQRITVEHWLDDPKIPVTVVGVVAPHQLRPSAPQTPPPRIYFRDTAWANNAIVRVANHEAPTHSDAALRSIWEEFMTDDPYRGEVAQDLFAKVLRGYQRLGLAYAASAAAAILIACLGLYGLVSFAVQRNARQVAIRRVLGASSASIQLLLGLRQLRPVLAATQIAKLLRTPPASVLRRG